MEEEKKFSIEDNINLDEIKMLLGEEPEAEMPKEQKTQTPKEPAAEIPETSAPEHAEDGSDIVFDLSMIKEIFGERNDGINREKLKKEGSLQETPEEKPQENPEKTPAPAPEKETRVPAETERKKEPKETEKKEKTSFAFELYGMLHDVIYLLVAVTLLFVFVVRLVGVKGESMLPTLHNADFLLLESNFLYHGDDLKYGDVIVISVPYFEEQGEGPIVKRVIATEGQTIDIDFDKGLVYVDGVLLQESYINEPTYYNWTGENAMEYPATVPEGCVFVMGDNRNNSMDSRYAPIGMIKEEDVLGKVLFILLPGETRNDAGEVTDARDWSRFGLVS